MGMVSDFVLGSYVLDGMGMVSDFVLGSYVLSSKPKTKSDTHEGLASFNPLPAMKPGGTSGRTSRGPHPPAFQSAPGDEAGRNSGPRASLPPFLRFNPLPAMKPGGTRVGPVNRGDGRVSIRSRR